LRTPLIPDQQKATNLLAWIRARWDFVLLIVVGIVIGVALARDYGISVDEYLHEVYARQTIETYLGHRAPGDSITDLRYYGPFFNVIWFVLRDILVRLVPGLHPADAGHLIFFLSFLAGVTAFYGLARRIVGRVPAAGGTLLFVTQPAIFGHAFINPKDIPFMSFFLMSVWSGLWATDRLAMGGVELGDVRSSLGRGVRKLKNGWAGTPPGAKIALAAIWSGVSLVLIDLFLVHWSLSQALLVVRKGYQGDAPRWIQQVFDTAARDAWKTPVEAYFSKVTDYFLWGRYVIVAGLGIAAVLASGRLLRLRGEGERDQAVEVWSAILIAGVVLGLCAAVRVFGVLVSFYLIMRFRRRVGLPLAVYWLVAAIVTYAAWPYLWPNPVEKLWNAVSIMSKFPFMGRVLYQGQVYSVLELPWHYAAASVVSELTLPALLLSVWGVGVALMMLRSAAARIEIIVLMAWTAIPAAFILGSQAHIYDALRQLLFLLPPLFLLGTLALADIFVSLPWRGWHILVIGVALLPGVIGIVRLHPYEYMYRNGLVGGVRGASGIYALESWCTSFRAGIQFINDVAPVGARVVVPTFSDAVRPFARDDLQLEVHRPDSPSWTHGRSGYALICTGGGGPTRILPNAEVLWSVSRDGVTLAVVKRLP
jgi:hypothetical protein